MDASRFDTLVRALAAGATRRRLLKLLAALGLGGMLAQRRVRPAAAYRCICEVDEGCCECSYCKCIRCGVPDTRGIAGGGLVRWQGGQAHLVLFASALSNIPGAPACAVQPMGNLRWFDPAWEGTGLALESTEVAWYRPTEGTEGGREVAGWVLANGEREVPFVLRAVDAGPPGAGRDTVTMLVGDAAVGDPIMRQAKPGPEPTGFRYEAEGTLASGDLQLLRFEWSQAEPGTPAVATPAP